MTRLEIAVRLMEASYRKSDMMTVTLTPENALDIADRLRAEDAKRTAAETPPATKSDGLQPLVVEETKHGGWNIHTPSREHYFSIGGWYPYILPDSFARQVGSFQTKAQAETTLINAEGTRPDRPAKVEGKAKCEHRFVSFLDVGTGIERRCNDCGNVVKETTAPRVKWRPASERPDKFKVIIMRGLPAPSPCVRAGDGETYTIGYLSDDYEDTHGYSMVPDVWCYLSEIVP